MTGNEKWVVLIGIHDIDVLVLVLGKKAFQPFVLLGIKGSNFVRGNDVVSFHDGQ